MKVFSLDRIPAERGIRSYTANRKPLQPSPSIPFRKVLLCATANRKSCA